VPRGLADARAETNAMEATRARQLMGMPAGDNLVDYRNHANLKYVYLYTWIRLMTVCKRRLPDQDAGISVMLFDILAYSEYANQRIPGWIANRKESL